MSWRSEWDAISNQIKGLIDAGTYFFGTIHQPKDQDEIVIKCFLEPHAERVFIDIQRYLESYASSLSDASAECLKLFVVNFKRFYPGVPRKGIKGVQIALTSLASFRSEFSYHLSDMQAVSRRITERAFVHLQRSIVADKDIQRKWEDAFKSGETECEKLGAVHLLSHGIWAFKASEAGERTDLVLGEPLTDISEAESVADALVLTEWKVIRKAKELEQQANKAYKQAKRYSCGVLAGFELANYRYLVIVSEKNIYDMPPVINDDNSITYKHINVAVKPTTPSQG